MTDSSENRASHEDQFSDLINADHDDGTFPLEKDDEEEEDYYDR
jgi:hypothetical protein